MLEINADNVVQYLRETGRLDRGVPARAALLAWGVSNVVLRVEPAVGDPLVLKQSRAQLRTQDPWFSRLDRIWRETAVMRVLQPLLPAGFVPRVLFEDRENYLFGMEAAPTEHRVWKQLLLEGHADPGIARQLGNCLATIHRETALRPELQSEFGDRQVFIELRVDPFYRRLPEVAPQLAAPINRLIDEMFATAVCLVHADFSPKNVLIAGERIVLVDFETGHYGDPAFDLGFFLSHLLLKTVLHAARFDEYAALTTAFWQTYSEGLQPPAVADAASVGGCGALAFAPAEIARRTIGHLAGCMWARVDGTSKVDYLHESQTAVVREFCRCLLTAPPFDWSQLLARLKAQLKQRQQL